MTIDTDFGAITLDETNRITMPSSSNNLSRPVVSHSPMKTGAFGQHDQITPATDSSSSSSSSVSSFDTTNIDDGADDAEHDSPSLLDLSSSAVTDKNVAMSDHKRAEVEGRHAEEPFLRDNPGRFVLFPIKEPEVSLCNTRHCHTAESLFVSARRMFGRHSRECLGDEDTTRAICRVSFW